MTEQTTEINAIADQSTEPEDHRERGGRVIQRRQLRRSQFSLFPLALLVIGIGVLMLVTPDGLYTSSPFVIGLLVAIFGLVLTLRFLFNGREERGIGTLGLTLVFTAIGVAGTEAVSDNLFNTTQIIAIGLIASSLAVWIISGLATTAARGQRTGTVVFGLALLLTGILVFISSSAPITFPARIGNRPLSAYWPIAAIGAAILLLPAVFKRRD